jgi:drug/metabolite transporter (DMT)-like permease
VDLTALLLGIGATLCWALRWFWMKVGVGRMNWVDFGFLRPWMVLPLVAAYAGAVGGFTFGSGSLVLIALAAGVLNAFFGTGLYYYALSHGTMHESNILANTNPFWGVISAIIVLGEPATWPAFAAGALVLGGTYFLVRSPRNERRERNLRALLAALGTGILWGFTAAVPTKFCMSRGMNPVAFQFLFLSSGAVAWTLALLPRLIRRDVLITKAGARAALASSVSGLFVGWLLWLAALQRVPASSLSPLIGLVLLFATAMGVVFLKQPLNRRMVIGGALTVAGVTLISLLAR